MGTGLIVSGSDFLVGMSPDAGLLLDHHHRWPACWSAEPSTLRGRCRLGVGVAGQFHHRGRSVRWPFGEEMLKVDSGRGITVGVPTSVSRTLCSGLSKPESRRTEP